MNHIRLLTVLPLSLGLLLAWWWTLSLALPAVRVAGPQPVSLPEQSCPSPGAACRPLAAGQRLLQLQATTDLTPSQDNTLIEHPSGALSNGAGVNFFVGRTNQPDNSIRRGLIAFDIANSGIPTGSMIISVTLRLSMSMATLTAAHPITLYRLLADWGEGASMAGGGQGAPAQPGDATWTHAFTPTVLWATPGGDFLITPSASTPVGDVGSYTWASPQMVAEVQAWLDNPAANFGWLLQGNENVSQTVKRFDSKENPVVANRPELFITYRPPTYLPIIHKSSSASDAAHRDETDEK